MTEKFKVGDIVTSDYKWGGTELKYISFITPRGVAVLEEYDKGLHWHRDGDDCRRWLKDLKLVE